MKIRKLKRKGRNRIEWVLDYYAGPKRIRKWFRSRTAAEGEVQNLAEQTRTGGQAWADMAPAERADIMLVVEEARRENLTVRSIWERYKDGLLNATPAKRCTLKQAIAETIQQRRLDNLRERYVRELENYLNRFAAGRTEIFVDRIGVAEINQWFADRREAISTRKSNLGRLGSMFDVAWRRKYIPENPCLRVSVPKEDKDPPAILSVDHAKAMLKTCWKSRKRMLPWLVLGMFAGLRPDELTKLRWKDLNLVDGELHVSSEGKRRRARTVPLVHHRMTVQTKGGKKIEEVEESRVIVEWLKKCKPGKPGDLICPPAIAIKRSRKVLKKAAGIEWSHDLLRHTSGSYLLKFHGDAGKVAVMLGNSARILEENYKNAKITAADCSKFWAMGPKEVR